MSKIDVTELAKSLREKIAQLEATEGLEDAGVVIRVGDIEDRKSVVWERV